ncbi:ricin-type beta-trefoil lectin domain protein [Micromonospora echinofusca]|uniref:Ricin B lectin domain-containing protein n=1 Tax=Micromonospora echinofusca TaxID=47858 RepID=A0ABS3VSI0_MICEH|nr:ricin-type beta-trefoil lectin domain protein [Micromonospora echinofusca]MBO4207450.1 hypothetical protein [Micromonospora echinofusca]
MSRIRAGLVTVLTLLASAAVTVTTGSPAAAATASTLCQIYPGCVFVQSSATSETTVDKSPVSHNCSTVSSTYTVRHTWSKSSSYSQNVTLGMSQSIGSVVNGSLEMTYGWETGKTYSTSVERNINLPGMYLGWVELRSQKAKASGRMYANGNYSDWLDANAYAVSGDSLSGTISGWGRKMSWQELYDNCRLRWGAGSTPIVNYQNGMSGCLDVKWGNRQAGTNVWYWPCNGSPAQSWTYNYSTGEITVPHSYYNANLCLDASGGGTSPGTKVILWDCHGGKNQKWAFFHNGYWLVNLNSGLCLSAAGGWEQDLYLDSCTQWSHAQGWKPASINA